MKRILLTFAALLTLSIPGLARAEIREGSQEIGIHAGALFGANAELTDTAISGRKPELDDDFAVGLNYTYNFTRHFGLEGRYTFSPNTAEITPTGEIDLDLHLIDVNAVYHVNPHDPVVFYGTAGVGWAFADIDRDITGTINGVPKTISDDDGFTVNVGVGLKYEVVEHVSLRLDGRYRFIDQLVDSREEQLNTAEATVGIAWVF
ncbi:porin family protein [Candidatus Manganitrophus noduliformans]|uniref:Porin family protein n=1 Tax=Candidatus Manganitrophus noduliformans TaxID=2606439 RepID=A0A7X6IAD2_9BACT|nr:porin family protein [Candidatus Manganitrophus noduliformans]NKE70285.1 porin family protein [Candidatus Manganitrophus noduliformans]